MTIKTYSAWTYGHTIDDSNKFLDFQEGANPALAAELNVGSYTLGTFVNEISRAMNAASLNETYTVTLNRTTRQITISGTTTFSLLVSSGDQASQSVYPLAGFNGADRTGATSYEGDSPSGSLFEPQFLLQEYIPFENDQIANNVTVNETPSGILEVIKYGDINFMSANITLQKNQEAGEAKTMGNFIKFSATGYDDLLDFIRYAVTKAEIEFIEDVNNPDNFTRCLLESTPRERSGTGFRIRELYTRGLADWFETGTLVFRKIVN